MFTACVLKYQSLCHVHSVYTEIPEFVSCSQRVCTEIPVCHVHSVYVLKYQSLCHVHSVCTEIPEFVSCAQHVY